MGGDLSESNWESLPSRVDQTTDVLLEMFERRRVRATFFVLGWVAERHPGLIPRIRQGKHEIGSHGYRHRRVYEMGPRAFEEDLERSLQVLADAGSGSVRGFRAPEWSINDRSLWALDILAEKGLLFDSSMTSLRLVGNPSYSQVPHRRSTRCGELLEFPPLVARRMGQNIPLGGGWGLRMSSPRTVCREIEKRNRFNVPVALFVHPWEIDHRPPRSSLPLRLRFGHYFKLGGFRERLDEILAGAEFVPMGEVLGLGGETAA